MTNEQRIEEIMRLIREYEKLSDEEIDTEKLITQAGELIEQRFGS